MKKHIILIFCMMVSVKSSSASCPPTKDGKCLSRMVTREVFNPILKKVVEVEPICEYSDCKSDEKKEDEAEQV